MGPTAGNEQSVQKPRHCKTNLSSRQSRCVATRTARALFVTVCHVLQHVVLKIGPANTGNIQGRPDSGSARVWGYTVYWGIEFRKLYSILCVNLGIKNSLTTNFSYKVYLGFFLILVFYTSFSIIFGTLEGLFWVFWYSTTNPPPHPPPLLADPEY